MHLPAINEVTINGACEWLTVLRKRVRARLILEVRTACANACAALVRRALRLQRCDCLQSPVRLIMLRSVLARTQSSVSYIAAVCIYFISVKFRLHIRVWV